MLTRIDGRNHKYHFSSLHELGEHIAHAPRTWRDGGDTRQAQGRDNEREWDLGAGYDGAVHMARHGWLEGAARTQKALKAFPKATPLPETRHDFYGYRPDVPRYCAGDPCHMIRKATRAEAKPAPVLTLAVQIGMGAFTDANHAANFGLAVAQYVNQLETTGTRVQLIACYTCEWEHGGRVTFSWVVKNAGQPLDLAVIAFAIGHPAAFRRIVFAAMERSKLTPWGGYGSPRDTVASDIINAPPGTICLNGMRQAHKHAKTPATALEHVSRYIERAMAGDTTEEGVQ